MLSVSYPPFVHWEVTPQCNHNCIHCYNYWRKDKEKQEAMQTNFSKEHYLKMVQKFKEQHAHSVVVTGGEPLLVFDKIKDALLYLKKNGINISINTNAALLTSEMIDFLKENDIGLFISFPCHDENTCDFITNKKGSLKRILQSIDALLEKRIRFSLNVVASRANINHLQGTVDFLKNRYNIKKIYITRVGKPVNSDASFDKYLLTHEDLCRVQDISVKTKFEDGIDVDTGCPYTLCSINSQKSFELFGYNKICTAGKTSYAVDTFGNLKACPRDSTIYGNIFEEPFEIIWNRMAEWRDGSLFPQECSKCNLKEICKGGCRVDAFPFTGKLNSLDTSACLENLPIRYQKAESKIKYTIEDVFYVNPIKILKENFGYRLSYKASYVFVTDELMDFISNNPTFTLETIIKQFSVDYPTANAILVRLVKNGIIQLERR